MWPCAPGHPLCCLADLTVVVPHEACNQQHEMRERGHIMGHVRQRDLLEELEELQHQQKIVCEGRSVQPRGDAGEPVVPLSPRGQAVDRPFIR